MSQNQAPFVVATSNPANTSPVISHIPASDSPVVGHSPVHSPTSPLTHGSAIIITANIDNSRQQATSPVSSPQPSSGPQQVTSPVSSSPSSLGHRRTGSDASHRRQQFADSPQGSVHDCVNDSSSRPAPAGPPVSSREPQSSSVPANSSQSVTSTNGHSSVSSSTGGSSDSIVDTFSSDISPKELSEVEMRRRQRPLRQAQSDVPLSMTFLEQRRCSQSLTDAKEMAYARLMAELGKAQRELRLRDEECEKLSMLRTQMEHEIDELSAALFEEANKMVQDAHVRRMNSEKRLEDANHQIEILKSEVAALKHLVVTSTPSTPNKHLHPQICQASPKKEKSSKPFWKSHRRSTSHHQFTSEERAQAEEAQQNSIKLKEMDTVCFDEFQRWKLQPCVTDDNSPFLIRIFLEDIQPCLNFNNKKLAERVLHCVQQNTLTIEPIPGDSSFPRKCSLSDMHKLCNYKIKLEETDIEWYSISQMCRNRIAAVCDFYTYIRYITQGLVKSADKDIFQEIVKLRLQMATARLGC